MKDRLNLTVNGENYEVFVEPSSTLVEVLREELNLTGTKTGCDSGRCGACTVLIDGKAVKSCNVLAIQARGRELTTIEGLASRNGELHPLQQAFIEHFAFQCGFCTPGMIIASKALLDENPSPTEEEIKAGLEGNLCRCTGYVKIVEAVLAESSKIQTRSSK
jgi:carbon-monoxide dehydrogenase small subunit